MLVVVQGFHVVRGGVHAEQRWSWGQGLHLQVRVVRQGWGTSIAASRRGLIMLVVGEGRWLCDGGRALESSPGVRRGWSNVLGLYSAV